MKNFENDLYILDEELFRKYRNFSLEGIIDFNHATLQRPFREIYDFLNSNRSETISYSNARAIAAQLVNLKDPTRTIFGRNTTEALSFAYWLANVNNAKVICTDAENESVIRIFREHRDHGNTKGKDGWSTFPDDIVAENFEGLESIIKTSANVVTIPVIYDNNYARIVDNIDGNTKLVVLSHVRRIDGLIANIEEIARKIRLKSPGTFVAIDGAQALGNISQVDFEKLEEAGVDFYAATPHKTLGSYPLGILYVSNRAIVNIGGLSGLDSCQQIIVDGMIDQARLIGANVPSQLNQKRMASLAKAIEVLQGICLEGNDFSRKSQYAQRLKNYFISKLKQYGSTILEEQNGNYSPSILAFRFNGKNNREIVANLQQQGVFTSYISDRNIIRVSFDITNTKAEIDKYFEHLNRQ